MTIDPEDTFRHEDGPGLLVSELLEGDGPHAKDSDRAPPGFWLSTAGFEAMARQHMSDPLNSSEG